MPAPLRSETGYLNPIWLLRVLPALATVLIAVAFLTSNFPTHRHVLIHNACLGGALGLMFSYCVFAFSSIRSVTLKTTPQPSDVNDLRIT